MHGKLWRGRMSHGGTKRSRSRVPHPHTNEREGTGEKRRGLRGERGKECVLHLIS